MTAALDRCTAALGDRNVRAFLHVIREGESGHDDSAYTIINGGTHFEVPPWRHSWHGIPTTQGAKASGAYQFLGTTWARCAEALGFGEDFSPVNQDLAAVYLIDGRGALAAVMDGDLVLVCSKLAQEWVSLPGLGLARVQRVFAEYGGTSVAQIDAGEVISPAPIPTYPDAAEVAPAARFTPLQQPEKPMPLLLALLPSVLGLFAPRAQAQLAKITGQPADMMGPFLADLFAKIGAATGQSDPVSAVAALKTSAPETIAAVEDHALDYLDKLAPVIAKLAELDKARWAADLAGADAAGVRGRADRVDIGPRLVKTGDIMFGVAIAGVLGLMGVQMWISKATVPDPTLSTILVVLIYAVARAFETPRRYRFGGPSESNAAEIGSTAANQALAQVKKP